MRILSMCISISLLIFISGCAFSKAKLDVQYNEMEAKKGPLSSVEPVRIKVETIEDERPYIDRIGDVKNMYGMDCSDVVTIEPVPDVIRNAIITMLEKNGHIVTDEQADIIVSGVIETFWFESQTNFWTIEFMGTADLNLEFKDSSGQNTLLDKRYTGHHNEELLSGYHKEMQAVMNEALAELVNDILMDSQLVDLLKNYSKQPQANLY